jgi:Mn2+/Fe2+ NRAMP family transporter
VRGLLLPLVPAGGTVLLLGVVGGVGGTLTLLSYNYWMREKGWRGREWLAAVRFDLATGYVLTGVFGVALILLAGAVLHPKGIRIEGSKGVLEMAVILADRFGTAGEKTFLIGFWAAVATSMLGVWQGVPYLFADWVTMLKKGGGAAAPGAATGSGPEAPPAITTRDPLYRGALGFLTLPPMALLAFGKPVWIVVIYAATGSLFMPALAATLLVMNNGRGLGELRNGRIANAGLVLCLLLFAYLAFGQLRDAFSG